MDVGCILSINKNVRRRYQTCLCASQRQVCESRNPNIFSVWVVHGLVLELADKTVSKTVALVREGSSPS